MRISLHIKSTLALHIFNCDETGMPLNPKIFKVENKVSTKTPCNVAGNPKYTYNIMVLTCSSAPGYLLPHFVNFERKKKKKTHKEGG